MPSVISPSKALVTGANGYLGAWMVRTLIEHGYDVRGTVRTRAKGDLIKSTLGELASRFEYAIVDDVLKEDAFDDAVKEVEVIMHTLSPVFLTPAADEIIPAAVDGVLNLLRSAQKHQTTVRRVVMTSSICAIFHWPATEPMVYDEQSMNNTSVQAVEDGSVDPVTIYCASKTESEKRAWAYMQEQNITAFDLVCLQGSLFFGPYLLPISSVHETTSSLQNLYLGVIDGRVENPLFRTGAGWIDVRDMALAHVLAAQKEDAGGQRIIVSASDCTVADLVEVAHNIDPSLPRAASGALPQSLYLFDTGKLRQVLGLETRSLKETMRDSLEFYDAIPKKD